MIVGASLSRAVHPKYVTLDWFVIYFIKTVPSETCHFGDPSPLPKGPASKYIQAGLYRATGETPFEWRFAGGPIEAKDVFAGRAAYTCTNGILQSSEHKQCILRGSIIGICRI